MQIRTTLSPWPSVKVTKEKLEQLENCLPGLTEMLPACEPIWTDMHNALQELRFYKNMHENYFGISEDKPTEMVNE